MFYFCWLVCWRKCQKWKWTALLSNLPLPPEKMRSTWLTVQRLPTKTIWDTWTYIWGPGASNDLASCHPPPSCLTFRHLIYLHARGRKNAKCSVLSDKSWCPNYRGRTAKTGLILGVVIFTILVLCTMRTCYLSQIFASVINLLHFPSYPWQLTRYCSLGWPIGHS